MSMSHGRSGGIGGGGRWKRGGGPPQSLQSSSINIQAEEDICSIDKITKLLKNSRFSSLLLHNNWSVIVVDNFLTF